MSVPTLVHSQQFSGNSPLTVTPSVTPTPGNLMVLSIATRNSGLGPSAISGWTIVPPGVQTASRSGSNNRDHVMFYRVVQTGDTTWSMTASGSIYSYSEWSGVGAFLTSVGLVVAFGVNGNPTLGGPITTTAPALIIGGEATAVENDTAVYGVVPTSPSVELDDKAGQQGGPGYWSAYRVEAAGGTFTVQGTATYTGGAPAHAGVTAAFQSGDPEPIADFDYDPDSGPVPLTVQFTDTSQFDPTSWAWDFGDGGTSTSQNPSHAYTLTGNYSVTLTVTNAEGSDSITKNLIISVLSEGTPDPVPPGGALIEIYAVLPGSARWDFANWDEAVWSGSGWQDVTPESMDAQIRWGSSQPEQGVLARPEAGSWAITHYDPDRVLDPANRDSRFFGDLKPGLPVRVTHRGFEIRRGKVESIGHNYETDTGYMRVVDAISDLARSQVPSDTTLADTLFARARDAIAAAGLSVPVLPDPSAGDPALVGWVTGTEQSAWEWIADGALSILWVPYIDRMGRLGFREWANPYSRGRVISSPELVSLSVVQDTNGLYSVVRAFDGAVTVERRLTPPPAYGVRVYERDEETLNAEDWAQAVLEDRGVAANRWLINDVYPLTAASVETWAKMEAVETLGINYPEADPSISAVVTVVGGTIILTPKRDDEARWQFQFYGAQAAPVPLAVDGSDPVEFLFHEDGATYLYPDGSV